MSDSISEFDLRPLCPGNPVARAWMKRASRRIAELEAQHREMCKFQERAIQRAEAAEAKLQAVGELPRKWREDYAGVGPRAANKDAADKCADELDAALDDTKPAD